MKTFKKIISSILIVSAFLSVLVSCNKDSGGKDGETPKGINASEYVIVRADAANKELIDFIVTFNEQIADHLNISLDVKLDEDAESAKEIIIGDTTRSASKSVMSELAGKGDDAYVIRETDGKIIILGKTEDATVRAMKIFLMNHVKASTNEGYFKLEKGHNEQGKVNLDSIVFENFAEFYTEYTTEVSVPEKGSLVYYYPTMIKLAHNGEHNGTLIATHAGGWGAYPGYRIMRSTDNGDTWTEIGRAVDDYSSLKTNQITKTDNSLQPCLYELPRDMGAFKEGTLFLGALTRGDNYKTNEAASALILYYSTDLGATWTAYHTLAIGGDANSTTGVWEPFFIYEEETGRVYCFYSDESNASGTKNGPRAQELVYRYTTDMKRWSDVKVAVSCQKQENLRPGMISIAKMGNGKYYMTFEMVGLTSGPIYAKTTDNLDNWGDPANYGKVVKTKDGKTMGSAPWCAWTPMGGECGTLVVSADHMIAGKSYAGETDLFISFDYGETFIAIENPLPYEDDKNHKCGYSPFLGFSEDGMTLYYMNSTCTDSTKEQAKVVFARIKIW